MTTKLEQTKIKLDEECQINSSLQKNQSEWHLKFSNLEKDFNNYKITKDQVNIMCSVHCFIYLNYMSRRVIHTILIDYNLKSSVLGIIDKYLNLK